MNLLALNTFEIYN